MADTPLETLRRAILELLPPDGGSIGNQSLRERLSQQLGTAVSQEDYFAARDSLLAEGMLATGRGRGGSVRRAVDEPVPAEPLILAAQEKPAGADEPAPRQAAMSLAQARQAKTEAASRRASEDARVIAYRHDQKRKNNPDVGVVTPETDPEQPRTTWAWDPHIDPALQFDVGRAQIERLIDDALASGDESVMRQALEELKRLSEPYLNWAGKAERTSFEVDTVSLHVHERIDPASLLAVVKKRLKKEKGEHGGTGDLFRAWFEEPLPYREAIEFYRHDRGWANRLVAGDSLLVMNSLLQKEGMAGQVQMIYIDPPYGIKYGSNFQPFVNKRDVKDRKDEDLTQEPEMIKAFRDTWELGIHSYLTYLRDRLLLAKELLHESGSVFVQISDENLHHVREICDEVFGVENYLNVVPFTKTSGVTTSFLASNVDFLVWYAKDRATTKYRQMFLEKSRESGTADTYTWLDRPSGERRGMSAMEKRADISIPDDARIYKPDNITSQGNPVVDFEHEGKGYAQAWKTDKECVGLRRLAVARRLHVAKNSLQYVRYLTDFPCIPVTQLWDDMQTGGFTEDKVYVVQTAEKAIQRCLLMTTDPGDLVLDPTCGSGTTAFVAEKWGRRWITCDTSRVAVTLAKQRLMTASYDYYELKYPHEGLRGGFIYKTVPHVTLKSIANNPEIDEIYERMHPAIERALEALNAALKTAGAPFQVSEGGRKGTTLDFSGSGASSALQEWEVPFDFPDDWKPAAREAFEAFHAARQAMQKKMDDSIAAHADQETLYDQPAVSKDKLRITGPFTVEAVPFPSVLSLDEAQAPAEADVSVARSGESLRQHAWRDELLKTGIRGKGGQMLRFTALETLPDTRHLHCTGHADSGERVVVSFGPEHGALEQRQVELAMREAGELFPRPKMIVFCAFAFDPEAAKDIDATRGIVALKAQMNTDLLTEDLKKARSSNQSFWLMGQPDVELRQRKDGRYEVEVNGFDYFDTTTGELKSGGKKNIAAWSLDTDYDERSLFPRQVFFPMAGAKDGWHKLKRDIKAELDESRLDKLHGTVSLPFEPGENRKVAVKIVDDRGIESLKVIPLD
ncbi:MAG: site-specific DNA-methyltransferase [Xanthomonadaceae bacterium]|nr:site-specific DNA-methyltransferase [Xanthomonadaceae bacterium]